MDKPENCSATFIDAALSISTECKLDHAAKWSHNRLTGYDFLASFDHSSIPDMKRMIVGKGKQKETPLSHLTWQAGKCAVDFILNECTIAGEDRGLTLEELSDGLRSLFDDAEDFLNTNFYPDLIDGIECGRFTIDVPTNGIIEHWELSDFGFKSGVFFDFIREIEVSVVDEDDIYILFLVCLAILKNIDDCIVFGTLNSKVAIGLSIAIERMRYWVETRKRLPRQGAALGRALLSDLAKELAQRRHKAGNDAKKWVQSEWEAHKADYNHNKSAFARDYVRRLRREREVDVKEKQLKEVWLKDIPRLPQNGLPAADRVMTDP